MKTFKELKQRIFESGEHTFGGGFGDTFVHTQANSAAKDYGHGVFDLCMDDNMNRVNSFLNAYFKREFQDYGTTLGPLKTKLNMIGLDFDYDRNTKLREGMNRFEMNRFGGTFGKTPQTPFEEFERTNGFPDGVSYFLEMNVNPGMNGLYRINARLVRQADRDNGISDS